MDMPNLFEFTDSAMAKWGALRQRLAAKAGRTYTPGEREPAGSSILEKAWEQFEIITARTDAPMRVPHPDRLLNVDETDPDQVATVESLGATRNDKGQWVAPEGRDMDEFEAFWHDTPKDLRDVTPRYMTTKTGHSIESRVLPSDQVQGDDSTATVVMYWALPLLAALGFSVSKLAALWGGGFIGAMLGGFVVPAIVLATIPFLITIAQGEGVGDATKALLLLVILPWALASGHDVYGSAIGVLGGVLPTGIFPAGVSSVLGALMGLLVFLPVAFLGAFAFTMLFPNKNAAFGGVFQRFKEVVKWTLVIGIGWVLAVNFLPAFLQPVFYFVMAGLYPMYYVQGNMAVRASKLVAHDRVVNIGMLGSLSSTHLETRFVQAQRAVADTSPFLVIGTAMGWLTKRQYPFGPDAGAMVGLTRDDLSMHGFVFGMTGSGKTESVLRPLAKQWVELECGGMLVLDGKGDLGNDLSGVIDIMVKPGVDFAPFQGLSGQDVALALKALAGNGDVKEKDRIWIDGANDLCDHVTTLHEALYHHEQRYRVYARNQVQMLELEVDKLSLEVVRLRKLGEDTTQAEAAIQGVRKNCEAWRLKAFGERKWKWNVDTLQSLFVAVEGVRELSKGPVPSQALLEVASYLGFDAEEERARVHPQSIHPEVGKGLMLDGTLDFLLHAWTALHKEARSSFMMNVRQRLQPLSRGAKLVNARGEHWKTLERGVDLGQVLRGGRAAIDLPETTYGRAGEVVAAFAKQRIYAGVRRRGGRDWRADGEVPLLLLIDEAQLVVGQEERNFLPIARSLGMHALMAAQGYESIEAKLGSRVLADQFLNSFLSLMTLKASPQTYEFFSKRLGTAQMVSFKQPVAGLDMAAAARTFALSPLNDVDHPLYAMFRRMKGVGVGKPEVLKNSFRGRGDAPKMWHGPGMERIDDKELAQFIEVPTGGTLEVRPVFKEEEYSALLATPGHAIVALNRAGAPRVDVVKLNRVRAHELRKKEEEPVEA